MYYTCLSENYNAIPVKYWTLDNSKNETKCFRMFYFKIKQVMNQKPYKNASDLNTL